MLKVLNDALGDVDVPPDMEQAINTALATLPSEEPEETLAQRIAQYDALTLLKHAVVSWSYDYPVKSGSLEHVELLDAVTRDWLMDQELVQRNTRPLASSEEFRRELEMGRCPPELGYINALRGAGVTLTLSDYKGLASLNRDDLILWNEAEAQRAEDQAELDKGDK